MTGKASAFDGTSACCGGALVGVGFSAGRYGACCFCKRRPGFGARFTLREKMLAGALKRAALKAKKPATNTGCGLPWM